MHVAWSYCQAAGLIAKRKANQLEQFKQEESAGAKFKEIKIKKINEMFNECLYPLLVE